MLFGSALPKSVGGFLNTFNYKGINLSVFIDYKLGSKMLSGTNFNAGAAWPAQDDRWKAGKAV